jgi:hypothetical protein
VRQESVVEKSVGDACGRISRSEGSASGLTELLAAEHVREGRTAKWISHDDQDTDVMGRRPVECFSAAGIMPERSRRSSADQKG